MDWVTELDMNRMIQLIEFIKERGITRRINMLRGMQLPTGELDFILEFLEKNDYVIVSQTREYTIDDSTIEKMNGMKKKFRQYMIDKYGSG